MDKKSIHQFTYNLTKECYFKPIKIPTYYKNTFYITKQFLIEILFNSTSTKKQQKILKKAKQLNIWNICNDIFEPITYTSSTCKKGCQHKCIVSSYRYDFGECYDNKVLFEKQVLKLKLENIPDKMKIKYGKDDFYWINIKVLKSLIDFFIILISKPHSTIGFTDRTPIHLLPPQYHPLKNVTIYGINNIILNNFEDATINTKDIPIIYEGIE